MNLPLAAPSGQDTVMACQPSSVGVGERGACGGLQPLLQPSCGGAPAVAAVAVAKAVAGSSVEAARLGVAYNNLGSLLRLQGQHVAAIACYELVGAGGRGGGGGGGAQGQHVAAIACYEQVGSVGGEGGGGGDAVALTLRR